MDFACGEGVFFFSPNTVILLVFCFSEYVDGFLMIVPTEEGSWKN